MSWRGQIVCFSEKGGETADATNLDAEGQKAPFQNAMDLSNADAVICHGDALFCGAFQAKLHFPLIERTAAAMHDECVG